MTKLFRYTDKLTGEERGILYNKEDVIQNPDWNCEEIEEKDKASYISEHQKQIEKKQKEIEKEVKEKNDKARAKLASQGFTQDEIDGIMR